MLKKLKNRMFIVAEIGVNHNGSLKLAKKLVRSAKKSGADAVKFQTFITENLYNKKFTTTRILNFMKKLELNQDNFKKLKKFCQKIGIEFFSTPFDVESALFLNDLKVKRFKIASSNIRNYKLIEKIKSFNKEVIISSGYADIKFLKKISRKFPKKNLSILYCVSLYPAPKALVDLKQIIKIKKAINLKVGFSDHTKGIELAVASKLFGADILEKHYKLDNKHICPDQEVSATANEFKEMVNIIRSFESSKSKILNRKKRGQIGAYINKNLEKGNILQIDHIDFKRPSIKLSNDKVEKLIGRKLRVKVNKDAPLKTSYF